MIEILIIILISAICGFMVGGMSGWNAGKDRTRKLIKFLVISMEDIRMESRCKAYYKQRAIVNGQMETAQKLEAELTAESSVFYPIQRAISDWCVNNNEKDPFAL